MKRFLEILAFITIYLDLTTGRITVASAAGAGLGRLGRQQDRPVFRARGASRLHAALGGYDNHERCGSMHHDMRRCLLLCRQASLNQRNNSHGGKNN
jgi:hypothetical protein